MRRAGRGADADDADAAASSCNDTRVMT